MNEEILSKIDGYKSEVEDSEEYKQRKAFRKDARRILKGRHHKGDQHNDPIKNPSIQSVWLAIERIVPKVYHGHSFRPIVVPEAAINYQVELGASIRDVLFMVPTNESDAQKEARLRTAILDRAWDIARVTEKLKQATKAAAWYGDAWLLDSVDETGNVDLDIVDSANVWYDMQACWRKDMRYVGYQVQRNLKDLQNKYRDKAEALEECKDDSKSTNVWLECWFVRDYEEESETEEYQVPVQEVPSYVEDGFEVFEDDVDDGFVTVKRTTFSPKYNGGWRVIKRVKNVVLEDTDNYTANGELPLHWLPWYKTPNELTSRSVLDQVWDAQAALDEMVGLASSYAKQVKSYIIAKEGVLQDGSWSEVYTKDGIPVLKVAADEETPVTSVATVVPPAPHNPLYLEITGLMQNIIAEVTGSYDLRDPNNAVDPASGEAVEQLENAANTRLADIRNQVRDVARDIAMNMMANIIAYMPRPVSVDINGNIISIVPTQLSTDEVERSFDVSVGYADTLPQNGNKKNQAILSYTTQLLTLPPSVGRFVLKNLDLPFVEDLEAALNEVWNQPPPPQKDETSGIFASAYSASLVNIGKDDKLPLGLRLAALEQLRVLGQATGVVPTLTAEGIEIPQQALPEGQQTPPEMVEEEDQYSDYPRNVTGVVGTPDNPKRFM